MKRIILSGFGSGFLPIAPGTAGSIVAAAGYLALVFTWGEKWAGLAAAAGALAFTLATVAWAVGLDEPDPSWVVSDEIAGMFLALAAPLGYSVGLKVALGFAVYRALDVLKPVGIRRLEKLPGGWGVVLDDIASGALTGLLLATLCCYLRPRR